MMTGLVLGAIAGLLIAFSGGRLWVAPGHTDPDRARRASELRDDLREAHTSVIAARVDLYERNFLSASRRLEVARALLRSAEERGRRLGWRDEKTRFDFTRFEADIDEAQRLLGQLDAGAGSPAPEAGGDAGENADRVTAGVLGSAR